MEEANILCKNLKCDEAVEVFETDWPEGGNYEKMTIKCPVPKRFDNLWQCASPLGPGEQCQKRAAVTCAGRDRAGPVVVRHPELFTTFLFNRSTFAQVTRECGSWGTPTMSAAGCCRSKIEKLAPGPRS